MRPLFDRRGTALSQLILDLHHAISFDLLLELLDFADRGLHVSRDRLVDHQRHVRSTVEIRPSILSVVNDLPRCLSGHPARIHATCST